MARQITTSSLATLFSAQDWATLAGHLANQDLVLLPAEPPKLTAGAKLEASEQEHRQASALALTMHWASLGFVLSKRDALLLCEHDTIVHAWLHQHVTPALKQRLGGHVRMTPMYPNFPKQVLKADETTLLINALMHYAGDLFDVRLLPVTQEKARKALPKSQVLERVIRVADLGVLHQALADLTQMNTVWTPAQTALAKHALPLLLAFNLMGSNISLPQRENQAHLVGEWLSLVRQGRAMADAWPADRVSATDVLRAAVAYSGGDPSLASSSEKVRFTRFSRPQRRVLMHALETAVTTTAQPLADLHQHRQAWMRLAEQLHVGEWTAMPKARAAIEGLRNAPAPVSWNGALDALLLKRPTPKVRASVVDLFQQNPGYAARALRRVTEWATGHETKIIRAFADVASRVDTPVLLALEASFLADAKKPLRDRVMLPKGAAAWRYRVEATRTGLNEALCNQGANVCKQALLERFSELPALGKVFVEPGLDQVIVPKGLRSASDSVGVVTRGSWLPVGEEANIVRLFLWWKDTDGGRVDVDLSAIGVDKQFAHTESCNFHSLRESGMTHSGDLTSAPNGAAEFIDIRFDKLSEHTRYVVLSANVFHGPGFNLLPECFVGWQEREKGQPGEIMEVATVVDKFQVTTSSKGFLGVVFDVKERRLMWLDLPINTRGHRSIHDSQSNVRAAVEDFQLYAFSQPKVGHLVDLHIEARHGERVDAAKDADVVFALTNRKLKGNQAVIVATQPQSVASALMAGPKRKESVAQAPERVTSETKVPLAAVPKVLVKAGLKR